MRLSEQPYLSHMNQDQPTEGQKNWAMVKGSACQRQWLSSEDSEVIFPMTINIMDDRYTYDRRNVQILNKQGHSI